MEPQNTMDKAKNIAKGRLHYLTRASRRPVDQGRADQTAYSRKGERLSGARTLALRAELSGANLSGR